LKRDTLSTKKKKKRKEDSKEKKEFKHKKAHGEFTVDED